jgi:hemin uptake protein HemP
MHSLNQFAWISGTPAYQFGHRSPGNAPITGAPDDADLGRWSMLHDGAVYRLYCGKRGHDDILYQFGFDGAAYVYGHRSRPELRLHEFPADTDASSFAMLHDGAAYRLYLRRRGDPTTLYQAAWVAGTSDYRFGHDSIPTLSVTQFPADADWSRWTMLHDGAEYRYYVFRSGSGTNFYQGAFNRPANAYEYAHRSIPELTVVGAPDDSDTRSAAMLHDGTDYRLYFQTRPIMVPGL